MMNKSVEKVAEKLARKKTEKSMDKLKNDINKEIVGGSSDDKQSAHEVGQPLIQDN